MAFQTSSFIFHSANSKSFNLSEHIGIVIMAPHLVLFEHAAGYALFRSVDVIQNVNLLPSPELANPRECLVNCSPTPQGS